MDMPGKRRSGVSTRGARRDHSEPTRNRRAAPDNEPVSTTRMKASIAASRSMIIPLGNKSYRIMRSTAFVGVWAI